MQRAASSYLVVIVRVLQPFGLCLNRIAANIYQYASLPFSLRPLSVAAGAVAAIADVAAQFHELLLCYISIDPIVIINPIDVFSSLPSAAFAMYLIYVLQKTVQIFIKIIIRCESITSIRCIYSGQSTWIVLCCVLGVCAQAFCCCRCRWVYSWTCTVQILWRRGERRKNRDVTMMTMGWMHMCATVFVPACLPACVLNRAIILCQ